MTELDPPAEPASVPVKTSYHHGDLRRALVQAAEDLLCERGPGGVTLRGAATRAGVSSAAPYRHFVDKDALLVAVALRGYSALQDHVRAAPRMAGTVEAIHDLVRAYAEFATDHPQLYRLMMGAGITDRDQYAELTEAHDETCAILIDAVAEAQQHGALIEQNPVSIAMTLWCVVHGLVTLVIDGRIPPDDVKAEVELSLTIVDQGLRHRPDGGPSL